MYIKDYEGLRAIWNAKGDHGKIWLEAQVDYNSSSRYQVSIIIANYAFDPIMMCIDRPPKVMRNLMLESLYHNCATKQSLSGRGLFVYTTIQKASCLLHIIVKHCR